MNLDHFVDIKLDGSIYVNYALYTLISEEDDTDVFKNFKQTLKKTGELIFDRVGEELSMEIKALRPIPELQNEIDKCSKIFLPNMIGLHLRTSDGDFTKINWKSIIKKLILSCKKWCSQDQKRGVFLATDNSEVFIEFASSLSSKLIIYNPPSVLGGNVSSNKFNNDKYNVLVAVVELFLLGKCNEKIIGTCESTFSAVGMLLAENTVKKYLINDDWISGERNILWLRCVVPFSEGRGMEPIVPVSMKPSLNQCRLKDGYCPSTANWALWQSGSGDRTRRRCRLPYQEGRGELPRTLPLKVRPCPGGHGRWITSGDQRALITLTALVASCAPVVTP